MTSYQKVLKSLDELDVAQTTKLKKLIKTHLLFKNLTSKDLENLLEEINKREIAQDVDRAIEHDDKKED